MRLNMDTNCILGPNKGRYGKIRPIKGNYAPNKGN